MNKYTNFYIQKLGEEIEDPHITDRSRPQDPNTAGLLGAAGSLFLPVGALAPGLYAGGQSESIGEAAKASLRGLISPILGGLGGAAIGGLGGATAGGLLSSLGGSPSVNRAAAIGGGGAFGAALGGLLGTPIGGYLGARSGANKYNERLKKRNEHKAKETNTYKDKDIDKDKEKE